MVVHGPKGPARIHSHLTRLHCDIVSSSDLRVSPKAPLTPALLQNFVSIKRRKVPSDVLLRLHLQTRLHSHVSQRRQLMHHKISCCDRACSRGRISVNTALYRLASCSDSRHTCSHMRYATYIIVNPVNQETTDAAKPRLCL